MSSHLIATGKAKVHPLSQTFLHFFKNLLKTISNSGLANAKLPCNNRLLSSIKEHFFYQPLLLWFEFLYGFTYLFTSHLNTLYASPCDHSCDRPRMRQIRIVPVVGGVINRDLSATIAESRKVSLQIFEFIYRPELAELTRDFLLFHCCNGCH